MTVHFSFECRCGSRRTERTGILRRRCHDCGSEYHYRLSVLPSGETHWLPFSEDTAKAISQRMLARRAS